MSTVVYWAPPQELTPERYDVRAIENGTERYVTGVPHAVPSIAWNATRRAFFYEDPLGTDMTQYRVRAYGPGDALYGDTGPFQPQASFVAGLNSLKRLDHDYGARDAYRYVAPNGKGVSDATIRVFAASQWDAGRRDVPKSATTTDDEGRWRSSLWLEPGFDYVIVFEKVDFYGPDVVRVTLAP